MYFRWCGGINNTGEGQRHHGRVENPGKIEQIDCSRAISTPQTPPNILFIVSWPAKASAPDMAKTVLAYQCTGTSSSTIRMCSHAHHQLTNTITFLWCLETGQHHLVSRREHVHHLIGKQKPYIGWPVSFWRLAETRKPQESILQLNHQPSSEKISVALAVGIINQWRWTSRSGVPRR